MALINDPILVKIVANGEPLQLGLGAHVISFSYEDSEKEDDILRVTFADPLSELIDSEQIIENTEWTVQWGFPGKLHPARKVLVKRPRFKYGTVEVEALDKRSTLKLEERWEVQNGKSMKDIIEDIANRHQLSPLVDPELAEIKIDSFPFGGRTDHQVLKYFRSRAEDHIFKVEDDKLIFEKRNNNAAPKGTFEFAPGAESRLISFDIGVKDQDNAKSSTRTTTVAIDPFTHKKKIFNSDEETTPVENLGTRRTIDKYVPSFSIDFPGKVLTGGKIDKVVQGSSTGKAVPMPPKSDNELSSIAKSRRRVSLLNNVEARFEIVASPVDTFFKSGDIIQISGIGARNSGAYRILSIMHDMSEGYKYSITAKRNAVGPTGRKGATTTPPPKEINGPKNEKKPPPSPWQEITGVLKEVKGSNSGATYGNNGQLSGGFTGAEGSTNV